MSDRPDHAEATTADATTVAMCGPTGDVPAAGVGIVVIGRNEGNRLLACLASIVGRGPVVYVDSGSTDGSPEAAKALGAEVVELDTSIPFTAARARNAGADRLLRIASGVRFIQFVDGDCELADGWLDRAAAVLGKRPDWAVVCGRLRERHRNRTIYNRLADMEWDGPIGEIDACGGIMMVRAEAFRAVGGFDPTIIAAEDDELCLRLRRAGGRVVRIDAEMASHDIAMTRIGQWWRRMIRSGFAYADGAARHGRSSDRHFVGQLRSVAFWGLALPAAAAAAAWPTSGLSLAALAGYPLLAWRVARHRRRRGDAPTDARLYALFCTLAKFPQAIGMIRYAAGRLAGRQPLIIEHKMPGAATPASLRSESHP